MCGHDSDTKVTDLTEYNKVTVLFDLANGWFMVSLCAITTKSYEVTTNNHNVKFSADSLEALQTHQALTSRVTNNDSAEIIV